MIEIAHEWQTLIAGVLALSGAAATVWTLHRQMQHQREMLDKQIQHQWEQHEDQRRRQARAARAMLPEDLSAICEYARDCGQLIHTAYCDYPDHDRVAEFGPIPTLSDRVLANLQQLIEHLDESDADKLADLLECFQVQKGRFFDALQTWKKAREDGSGPALSHKHIEHPLIETIVLYLLSEHCLGFARRESSHIAAFPAVTDDAVRRAMRLMIYVHFPRDPVDETLLEAMRLQLVPSERHN
ncbi:hypothetical protein RM531_15575 [Salinisphaera sp. P385]|uniref:DUF4760 domain-containing protein n=1 Tax=Spectribacter acetivorans TaxID=3075603 RepID=A0ABU3BDF3_9GAMM|nr:hypothetical protein [Salinisphaera sp. P385]MDT0619892.1 hypothetical protein [Salinisphaera sp. P385]